MNPPETESHSSTSRIGTWARWANGIGFFSSAAFTVKTHPIPLINVSIMGLSAPQSSLLAVAVPIVAAILMLEVVLHFFADLNPTPTKRGAPVLTFPVLTTALLFTLCTVGSVRKNPLLPYDGAQASFAYWGQIAPMINLLVLSIVFMTVVYWLPSVAFQKQDPSISA